MKAYKVVLNTGRECGLVSSYAYLILRSYITYKPGQWVKPKPGCGPLAAFRTFKHAKIYAVKLRADIEMCEIWEADVMPWKERLPRVGLDSGGPVPIALWDRRQTALTPFELPRGTLLCQAIKLTQKVWP